MRSLRYLIVAVCLLMPGAIPTVACAQPAEHAVPGDPLAAAREALPRSLDRARELGEAALAEAEKLADPGRRAAALAFLAGLELSARNEESARQHLDALDALLAVKPTLPEAALACYLRGRWLRDRREDTAATAAFEQAATRAAAVADSETEAKALHAHAILLVRSGGQERAEALLLRALEINQAARRERDADANRHYLGLIARDRGDYSRAAALHAENLAHSEQRGDQQGIANSANALGALYAYRKENAAARRYFEQALAAYRAHGDRRGASMALANLAEVLNRDVSQPYVANPAVEAAFLTVYRQPDRYWELYQLAEKLVDAGVPIPIEGDALQQADGKREVLAVDGGFISVADNRVSILSQYGRLAHEILVEEAERERRAAWKRMNEGDNTEATRQHFNRAHAQLAAAKKAQQAQAS